MAHAMEQPGRGAPTMLLDLYWIPLGAGARTVRFSGRTFERLSAFVQRRPRCDLYHSALVASDGATLTTIEMAPVPDRHGRTQRGVVAEGCVGLRALGVLRIFRYEVRRWTHGLIPDLPYAVASPIRVASDETSVRHVLDVLASVPTPVWGRDELGAGEMWNSNSVISWTLARAGIDTSRLHRPEGGRAPGWDAGIAVAERTPR
jgi:hypothetical protein